MSVSRRHERLASIASKSSVSTEATSRPDERCRIRSHRSRSSRMDNNQRADNRAFLANCERIHREWHERAKAGDTNGLLALYADDAVLETPLVQAIFDGRPSGTLRGHRDIRPFFVEGARRRPNDFVRWHRSGRWLTDGERLLVWEYPRGAGWRSSGPHRGHGDCQWPHSVSPNLLGLVRDRLADTQCSR